MLILVLVSAFIVTVNGQTIDPTKVCIPDLFQTQIFSLERNLGGTIVFNFLKQLVAVRYTDGSRVVINSSDFTTALINDTDNRCVKLPPDTNLKVLNSQCLPANAKLLTDNNTYLGLNPGSLEIEAWEYEVSNYGIVRTAVTTGVIPVPIISQLISTSSVPSDINLFANAKAGIDDSTIFNIPPVCPPLKTVD